MKLNMNNITQVATPIPTITANIGNIITTSPVKFNAVYEEYVVCEPRHATHTAIFYDDENGHMCSVLIAKTDGNQILLTDLI